MSLPVATQISAIATVVLAVGAIITAVFAFLAFRKQGEEVSTLKDQLGEQSREAGLLERQLGEQQDFNKKQAPVLALQADELRESIKERQRDREQRHRAQAIRVFIWEERWGRRLDLDGVPPPEEWFFRQSDAARSARAERPDPGIIAHVKNSSDLPVYWVMFRWYWNRDETKHSRSVERLVPLMPGEEQTEIVYMETEATAEKLSVVTFFRDAAGTIWRARPDGQLDEVPADQVPSASADVFARGPRGTSAPGQSVPAQINTSGNVISHKTQPADDAG